MLTAATGTGPGLQASSSDVSAYSYNPSGNALGGPQAMGTMPNAHAAFGSQYLARVEEGMNNANLLGKTVTITGHLDPGTAVQHQGYDPCIVNADANIITGTEHLAFTVQADGSLVGTYTDDTTYTGDASKLPMPFQPDPGAPKKGQIVMLVPVAPMHAKTVLGNDSPMMFSGGNLNWCQAGLPDATQYCGRIGPGRGTSSTNPGGGRLVRERGSGQSASHQFPKEGIIVRFTNTLVTLAAAIAAAGLLAACGSSAASTGSSAPASSGGSAPATAPATSGWTPGGSYAGPVPPPNTTGLPDPSKGWQLPLYTSPDGYKVSDRLIFGVPLHYAIPQVLIDCNTAYPGQKSDLPPGQYVIPFEMRVENETGQQAPALAPLAWIGDVSGNATLSMTNGQHGADTYGTWQDGSCNMNNGIQLNAGGSTALYGFVGPATPAQLASAYVYVSWATGNNVPGTPPQLSMPLASLLPPAGASWLAAHGGHAPAPAASPSSMPVACPSAPSGLTGDEQANFNSVCGIWIGQVSDLTNQFKAATASARPARPPRRTARTTTG